MKLLGNIIWVLFGGLFMALGYVISGLILMITIIGIPFGLQTFKLARLTLWPFGTIVKSDFSKHPIANIIWLILGGLELALGYAIAGIIFYITIIGIPFGKQCFKLAQLALFPFGANVA